MLSDEERKAIDILINEIADIVISEYCIHCKICENEDTECYYTKVIDIVYNLVQKQSKEIEQTKYIKRNFDYCIAVEKKKLEDKIKTKIEVLDKLQEEFPNNDEIRIKIIAYKELLEKE